MPRRNSGVWPRGEPKVGRALLIASALLVGGCSVLSVGISDEHFASPTVRTDLLSSRIHDDRNTFAAIMLAQPECEAKAVVCSEAIRFPEMRVDSSSVNSAALDSAPQVLVLIDGIFGECVRQYAIPFGDSSDVLARHGITTVLRPPIEGRSSSERNAVLIDGYLQTRLGAGQRAIVVAYSKGLRDFSKALERPGSESWSSSVVALVSVAGVVNGSPLAHPGESMYQLLSSLPAAHCGRGDEGGVRSLKYDSSAGSKMEQMFKQREIRTYSIAAIADRDAVNPLLAPFFSALSRADERNDGQLMLEDAILPGSTLLAIGRADHWSIALPFEHSQAVARVVLGRNNRYPRPALMGAILSYILADQQDGWARVDEALEWFREDATCTADD